MSISELRSLLGYFYSVKFTIRPLNSVDEDHSPYHNGVSQGIELRHNDPCPGKLLLGLLGSSLVSGNDLNQRLDLRDYRDGVDAAHLSTLTARTRLTSS